MSLPPILLSTDISTGVLSDGIINGVVSIGTPPCLPAMALIESDGAPILYTILFESPAITPAYEIEYSLSATVKLSPQHETGKSSSADFTFRFSASGSARGFEKSSTSLS